MQTAGAGLAMGVGPRPDSLAADNEKSLMIIDCHAHLYAKDASKYPTVAKPYPPPPGTGTVDHLRREMKAAGVRYVTAVQTTSYYGWDNRFTTETTRKHPDWATGICTLDPDDPESGALLENYVKHYNVRGLRSYPAKSKRLVDQGVETLWARAEKLGIVVNVLANRDMQKEIRQMANRHPGLPIVLDHCLNLKAGPEQKPTLQAVTALADCPNLHAKLTFIPTGSAEDYPCRDMHEACLAVLRAYGKDRCVWGSNFPCELWCPKVDYALHLKIITHELGIDQETQRAVLGGTADRLWFRNRETSK